MPSNKFIEYKSPNFENNKNPRRMSNQAKKNAYTGANLIASVSKQKYIPIATRSTYNSVQVSKSMTGYSISSINYKNVSGTGIDRYHYSKANSAYTIKGVSVSAGKNAGHFKWFSKSATENKQKLLEIQKRGVIK